MQLFYLFLVTIIAYLIGSFPTAYLVVKKAIGKDIRTQETGNVGAMNTARSTGKAYLFALVFIVDALKGIIAMKLPELFPFDPSMKYEVLAFCGFAVVLGHCYSIYFKLKDGTFAGGKAISTLAGIALITSFSHMFIPIGFIFYIVVMLTRNFFASQFFGVLSVPFIALVLTPEYLPMAILVAIPILLKQAPRVIPMLKGEEPTLYSYKVTHKK